MEWLTDEILYVSGLVIAGCSLVSGFLSLCILKIKKVRLDAQLTAEYGEKK